MTVNFVTDLKMKTAYFIFSFVCAALTLPVSEPPEQNDEDSYPNLNQLNNNTIERKKPSDFNVEDTRIIYSTKNNILNLVLPLHSLTYKDVNVLNNEKKVLFIIESNNNDGNIISVYKGGNVTKLIDGNDVTEASAGDDIYIATSNGIYTYKDNKTEKYGTLNDKFINIALINNRDLYALSGDKKLYKIINNGTKTELVNEVIDAVTMVVYKNDIYYQNSNNDVFIYNNKTVKKVEGMPNNVTKLRLMKAIREDEGVAVLINNDKLCFANCNESCYIAECTKSTVGHLINSVVISSWNNWFISVGNAVFEYDYTRLLYEAIVGRSSS